MSQYKVLVTGGTFIKERHEKLFKENGIEIVRLNELKATEQQLIQGLKDKDGYILGGIEKVTHTVIESGNKLKAICFTGAGWTSFIPDHDYATIKGIPITAAPGANAQAVAELTVALIHDRVRLVSFLSGEGSHERFRARNFRNLTLGIVGAGNIGIKVARALNNAYGIKVIYFGRSRKLDFEFATGAKLTSLDDLLRESDIVSIHLSKNDQTNRLINKDKLALMKNNAILIHTTFADAVDPQALFKELISGRISAGFDISLWTDTDLPDFSKISKKNLIMMGSQTGYNTEETVELASDLATSSMINLLLTGNDKAVVNPEFKNSRRNLSTETV